MWPHAAGVASCCWCGFMLLVWPHVVCVASCCLCGLMLLVWPHVAGVASCCWSGFTENSNDSVQNSRQTKGTLLIFIKEPFSRILALRVLDLRLIADHTCSRSIRQLRYS